MTTPDVPDLSSVSDQRAFIESRPDKPSPTSTLATRRFSTGNEDGSETHTVVGVHVVLAKGDPNGLWEALAVDRSTQRIDAANPKVATRALTLCCDTLEVRGEFSLPEADVDVFARRLLWSDESAAIDTSPLEWTTQKARGAGGNVAGQDGADGRRAGGLRVFVHEAEPPDGRRLRLVARGGRGQDPGAGQDGTGNDWMNPYASYPFKITDSGVSTSKKTVSFSPPAVYIEYEWRWAASRVWGPGYLGENRFPRDGTDALAPGVPGSGGDGGGLVTNLAALAASFRNDGGAPGAKERDYRGGAAGQPTLCARYKVKLWENLFGTDNASFELKQTDQRSSKRGADAPARPPARGAGATPAPAIVDAANAWLHPLGLQAALEYARDLFLAGARDEVSALLEAYQAGLAAPRPDNGAWNDAPESQWTAAQAEVAAMMQRLRAQLDYFGHPAGYTPLLSLPGAIRLYAGETQRALRMMLLARWITDADHDAREAGAALSAALTDAIDDSRLASDQVAAGEAEITQVQGLIGTVERDLTGLGNRLAALRNDLLVKAINDKERQAAIKFSIKMAAALCQLVPVGQPALGTVGSLAAVAADFVDGDPDAAPDTLSKMAEVLKKAGAAADKAKGAGDRARQEKDAPAPKDASAAKTRSSAWAAAGKGLGPALSLVGEGVKALQVPQSEVDAELARLESEDPEWNRLTRDLRDLNEKKVALFRDLADAIQRVGEGFARLASNAGAIVSFQQQREKALGKVDPEAVYAVRQLGQRSRLTLQKYLYLMVKAYESTILAPLAVDWNLSAVTEKINDLLKPDAGFDAASLNAQADALDVLFQQNLSAVRDKLLDEFDLRESTITLKLGLSARQTPEILASLNRLGHAVVNPQAYGLVLPDQHLARLSGVAVAKLGFDPDGPQLPDTTNAVISLVPATTGTMRRAEGLYLLASDAPVRWGWTYMGEGDIRPSTPSATATDILDFILGTGSDRVKQKVSLPPAWSDLTVSILFAPPLPEDRRPRLDQLYFEFRIDSSPAPGLQRVLSVRSSGTPGGALIGCSPDLARRGDGLDSMIRIYNKGDAVRLSVPNHAGGAAFDGWDVIGTPMDAEALKATGLAIQLDDHVLAVSHWSRAIDRTGPPVVLSHLMDETTLAQIAEQHGSEAVRAELRQTRALRTAPPAAAMPIRVEPRPTAAIVGVIPADGVPDCLEETEGAWELVNYQGVVGWIAR
jgi:hypothetical protein